MPGSRRRWGLAVLLFAVIGVMGSSIWVVTTQSSGNGPAAPREEGSPEFTNRLIDSGNPYLLLHAHNPVDWYPWGPEAFEIARRENKPIFLSVGYSTCFWCHVAERTIYSDPRIAEPMNQWFVNVKVDREQRPEVDQIYMLATRIMTGRGGWPNNVFVTPDLRPFFAGRYFPPADDPVRGTGFPTILRALHEAWTNEHVGVQETAENVSNALRLVQARMRAAAPAPVEPAAWLRKARESLLARHDARYGGFSAGGGPKFPSSPDLALLLTDVRQNAHEGARSAVTKTLDAIAFGGIHDHLAGGFHRYSTEPTWSVPHFEKMLYDNAQLLRLFAESHVLTDNALHRDVAIETAQYLTREMSASPPAGFFTAQDAQIEGIEGVSYVWTRVEIAAVLGESDAERFFRVYELAPMPEQTAPGVAELPSRDGERPGVLRVRLPIEQTVPATGFDDAASMLADLAPQRAKLLSARNRRPQPARDEKLLTGLNGLAIDAFARAGQILNRPDYVTLAKTVADRIWSLAYDAKSRTLRHTIYRGRAHTDGFLLDYAHLGAAFMTLADVTGSAVWRNRAALLADDILRRFAREDGSFSMSTESGNLLVALPEEGDSEMPSGTSAAIELLLRLGAAPENGPRYRAAALRAVHHLSGILQQYPSAWATTVVALNDYPLPPRAASTQPARATGPESAPEEFRIPVTADHVRVSAAVRTGATEDRVVVTAAVDEGYHINANPASFDYLIPTAVKFESLKPTKVLYPKPVRFKAAFAPDGLDVYEGAVQLVALFPKGSLFAHGAIEGIVAAQACDERICLPPSDLSFSIAPEKR